MTSVYAGMGRTAREAPNIVCSPAPRHHRNIAAGSKKHPETIALRTTTTPTAWIASGDPVPTAQQIKVARGATRLVRPEAQQHRPLEHEAISYRRLTEAIEQPLKQSATAGKAQARRDVLTLQVR